MRTPQLPTRLHWDHNAHYHRWILRQLPAAPARALDAGCGAGRLAGLLAELADEVDAVDRSPVMIAKASATLPRRNVRHLLGDVLDPGAPLAPGGYDAVTAVSSLHHMPLRPALGRLAGLVRPAGVLVVIGHYRPDTVSDQLAGLLALPANLVVGALLALRGRSGKPDDAHMPVQPPQASFSEIRAAADELIPGARVRRRLFWRYSLVWRRPAASARVGER